MSGHASPTDTDVPVARVAVEWVELDGEAVLYDPTAAVMHRLNRSATAVWKACDGSRSVAGIVEVLCRSYPGAEAVLTRDVRGVLASLERLDLIVATRQRA